MGKHLLFHSLKASAYSKTCGQLLNMQTARVRTKKPGTAREARSTEHRRDRHAGMPMNSANPRLSFHCGHALMALSMFAIAGCGQPVGLAPWQEEVLLNDGRVIVVERYEDSEVRGPIGDAKGEFLNSTTLKFIAPPELTALPTITMQYRPVLLDYDPSIGLWFVIGVNERMCFADAFEKGQMDATGRVNVHPNFEFQLHEGRWREVEIGSERLGLPANLLVDRTTIDKWNELGRPVPLAEKQRLASNPRLPPEYRSIKARLGCR
jgi:hypothetical protein